MPHSPVASEVDFGGNDVGDIDFEVDPSGQPHDVSGLGLSVDNSKDDESRSTLQRSDLGSLEISGLDEESEAPKKRKAKEVGPKRMKKRRKIVIDNNATELTSDHMKAMLRDTSDIVMQNRTNIGDWDEEEEEDVEDFTASRMNQLFESVPIERLLARPCLGDDGGLAPELLALWGRNTVKGAALSSVCLSIIMFCTHMELTPISDILSHWQGGDSAPVSYAWCQRRRAARCSCRGAHGGGS